MNMVREKAIPDLDYRRSDHRRRRRHHPWPAADGVLLQSPDPGSPVVSDGVNFLINTKIPKDLNSEIHCFG